MSEIRVTTRNFDTATIGGHRVDVRNGRLMVRTHGEDGRYSWDATGAVGGVIPAVNRMTNDDAVPVEFEMVHGETCSGSAFVEVSTTVNQSGAATFLRLHGTGDLAGWEASR